MSLYGPEDLHRLRCVSCGGKVSAGYGEVTVDGQMYRGLFVECEDCGGVDTI